MSCLSDVRYASVQCFSPEGLHQVAYKDWGDVTNPNVVVCVHGVTRNSGDFDDLAAALSDRYRVVSVDVVGRGRSSWFSNPNLYQIPQYVSDIVTLIARLNVQKVNFIGTSMGGLIGMGLACLPNNPLKKLVLNDVGPVLNPEALNRIGQYIGKELRFSTFDEAASYMRSISASFGEHTEAQWHKLCSDVLRQDTDGTWIRHYDLNIAKSMQVLDPVISQTMQSMLWASFDAIACPTLLLRGADSDLLSAASAHAMTQRGPKPRLVEFANIGHVPTLMHLDQIKVVDDFLAS